MATASANTPPAELEALTPSSLGFPTRGHQRARSVSTGDEGSPNNFVFPRKAPIPGVTHFTRPRSGTTDAITLLAEIGVLPPPGTAAAARLRSPVTPYYPNRQRPVSMLALPTQTLPSVTLASAPAGRTNKRNTSELPDNPIISAAVSKDPPCEEELQVKNATGPPPGYQRRGHAHRRSGAISSSDVWNLLSQSAPSLPLQNGVPTPKADQPPAAPEVKLEAGIASAPRSHHAQKQSWSAPVSPACGAIAIPPSSPTPLDLDKKSSKVAFTERVEIIPRPLSPASPVGAHGGSMSSIGDVVSPLTRNPVTPATPATLGTPTTLATPATPATPVTPGRPRSNTRNRSSSISSSQSPLSPELQAQFAHMTQRPSTAGAVLSPPATPLPPVPTEPVPQVPALRIETAAMPPTPTSPIEPEMPKSPTKFWAPEKSEKPEKEKKARKKSHKKALSDGSPQTSSPSSLELFGNATEKVNKPSSRVKKGDRKKKKHLKNFLFGKGKHEKDGKTGRALKRSPTPPSRHNSFRKQGEMELLPAWTESYVILPEGSLAGRSLEELSSTMSPRYPGSSSDGDSPIIDLDAAMGPFNSPVVGSGSRSSGGFSAAKRRMHSSGAGGKMSIVSGVISNSFAGTHRRSESMPEMGMPLFDLAGHAGMEMEDVFEEDEEDEEESSSGSDSGSETDESEDGDRQRRLSAGGLGIGIQVIDGDGVTTWEEGISVDWNNVPRGPRRSSLAPTLGSNGSLKNASIQEEDEPEEDTTATRPTSLFYQNNDSAKSQSPSPDPCSTPTSLVPSTQSSTSTVTPTSAVSTASTLPDTPATSCPSESMSMNMPLPSPSFAAPKTTSPGSRRNSLSLKELVDLSLQEGSGFDPYADSEFQFLGEPGPEMRMSVSVEDVPSLTSSGGTMTSSYAACCAAGILQQPSTPKIEEIPVGAVGSGVSVAGVKGKDKDRGLKKKWSRVFKFWESEEKEQAHKEKKDKEHHGKDKVKEKEEKSLEKEKTHKKEEKMQKEKREKKGKAKICKEVGKKERI